LYRGRGVASIADNSITNGYRIAKRRHASTVTRLDYNTPIAIEIAASKCLTANAKRRQHKDAGGKPQIEDRALGQCSRICSNEASGASGYCDFPSSWRLPIVVLGAKAQASSPLTCDHLVFNQASVTRFRIRQLKIGLADLVEARA
jgi:hypothetical protein